MNTERAKGLLRMISYCVLYYVTFFLFIYLTFNPKMRRYLQVKHEVVQWTFDEQRIKNKRLVFLEKCLWLHRKVLTGFNERQFTSRAC